jgi:hypothetical protein
MVKGDVAVTIGVGALQGIGIIIDESTNFFWKFREKRTTATIAKKELGQVM